MEDNSHLINQLYREISELSNAMSKNNEILARLRKSYQDISSSQEEFMQNKRYINQPELTASTWAGKHANEFNEIRKEIESSYMRIGNNDIEGMLNNIEDKISYYEGLNKSLSNAISSKRNRISQLSD
ncbi:DUF5082 family protein [Neobacillus sp. WH10]|uniref:YwqH-like family protein n=1 Tax=Neobacillus sp. WH10 TaxID=3047873 RepID=UPI0024C1CA4D|nr:DUF5082 family protein [Neobacillus sp. WH10]WHY78033.1 DUF5082 family protein [Neobacillus sp. WH10]